MIGPVLDDEHGGHLVHPEAGGQRHQPQARDASGQQKKQQEIQHPFARRWLTGGYIREGHFLTSLQLVLNVHLYIRMCVRQA